MAAAHPDCRVLWEELCRWLGQLAHNTDARVPGDAA